MSRVVIGGLVALVSVASATLSERLTGEGTLKLPATPYRYANVALPAHFAPFDSVARSGQAGRNDDNTPPDNPLSDDGATLGRVLFYDTRLSANNTTSCASCHVQAHAFAARKPFSRGFHGRLTDRRAPPLVNLRYYQRARFFWDERAGNLEEMVLLPIQSRVEMGQDLSRLVDTLAHDATYPKLFARAFGDRQITERRVGKALAQFVRALVSYQSRYDEGRAHVRSAQDDFDTFTLVENRGKALFMRNCSTCHMKDGNEHFLVATPANTGLRRNDPAADGGVGDVTLRDADLGSFKSPSLRNVELTAPYSHDGRFATLEALIDHYSDDAILDPNIGYVIPVGPLTFTASEKAALVAFLKTLTDRTFLNDPRFSNPFADRDDAGNSVTATVLATGALLMGRAVAAPEILPLPPQPRFPAVTDRLMSFDKSADRRISRNELPERLQGLVARGDRNADAALDLHEIRYLANAASSARSRLPFRPRAFDGLDGVVSDLKLPPSKHARALLLVRASRLPLIDNGPASSDLLAEMKALLDDQEYEDFVAAASRLARSAEFRLGSFCKAGATCGLR
jgi:cytochrome c peroxidase